jgi:hypothetical protein
MSDARRFRILAITLLAFAVGGVMGAFYLIPTHADDNDNGSDENPNPPVRLTIKNGVPTLTITTEEQENAGIIAQQLEQAPPQDYMRGFATVLDPVGLADFVNQYHEAEAQIALAKLRLAASQAAYQRAQILNKDQQNVSTAQLQSTQSAFDLDSNAFASAQARAATVLANARLAWGDALTQGIAENTASINDIVARRAYLVRVTLPPGIVITTPPAVASALYGGNDVRLAFVSMATTADPKLQGVSYFYATPAQTLLPGLTLDVTLAVNGAEPGLVVPDSAVVWLEGKPWIYVRVQPTIFIRRAIDPSRAGPRDGYIVSGLAPNSLIVIRGAQMLLSEEFRASVPVED